MKKSITTRLRVTKNGKVLHRTMAQCHFRAKKTGKQIRNKAGHVDGSTFAHRLLSKPGTL